MLAMNGRAHNRAFQLGSRLHDVPILNSEEIRKNGPGKKHQRPGLMFETNGG